MKIRELLSDESKWTQGQYARDRSGQSQNSHSPDAICFCLIGATIKCYPDKDEYCEIRDILYDEVKKRFNSTVIGWNDNPNRTFEDVKKLVEELDI